MNKAFGTLTLKPGTQWRTLTLGLLVSPTYMLVGFLIGTLLNTYLNCFQLEAYWTYELCHGKFIRQYHEEREGKKVKIQEYYLGKWDKTKQAKLRESLI